MKLCNRKDFQLKLGLFSLILILIFIIFSVLSFDVSIRMNMQNRLNSLSSTFPLGTDDFGRDLLSCVIYGIMVSILVGFSVCGCSMFLGIFFGLTAGLAGGIVDAIIMRICDIILAFPGILLGIFMASLIKVNIFSIIGVLTFSSWAGCARLIRGEIIKYKKMDFVMAARSYNSSFMRIVFVHFLPIVFPLIFVQAILIIGEVMLAESTLNFLGIGLSPEIPTLGSLIDTGLIHIFDQPSLVLVPGVVLFWLVLSFNLIGEGLNRYV